LIGLEPDGEFGCKEAAEGSVFAFLFQFVLVGGKREGRVGEWRVGEEFEENGGRKEEEAIRQDS